MTPLFSSRDERYRSPFGAQPTGQAVFFRICPARGLHCSGARLCVQYEACRQDGEERSPVRSSLFWAGMEGELQEWWDCHYTPEEAGIYWYWFELDTAAGERYLARRADGTAEIAASPEAPRWQLTCYEPGFQTPGWLSGGIFYQIFPDRFARSGEKKEGVPSGRKLREDWGGQPEWETDEHGKIANRDYFQGDFKGMEQRLDRLAELGVTCLYLNPVFEAHSNHRYDTADYTKIDPLLGTEEDFRSFIRTARQLGIRVLLDGVFSHTGADSVYFNREGRYPSVGAAQSAGSPYYSWYRFRHWPDRYACWWGVETLPEIDKLAPGFEQYINGENGVVRRRIREGAAGWRLDVADELPDEFLDGLRGAAKTEEADALVLGEVWEDASNKVSYGHRRRYLLGGQLDSVMNYPFRAAILDFFHGGDAALFFNRIEDIVENYPPQVTRLLMNVLGTHDTERVLTALADEPAAGRGREWQAGRKLPPPERERGLKEMRLAAALQYTLPGVPCIYYGDEAGMEGYRDPFNRGCYPWGGEDAGLLHWYRRLGQLRHACPALKEGRFVPLYAAPNVVCYERTGGGARLLCAVNAAGSDTAVPLAEEWRRCTVSLGDGAIREGRLFLPALGCALVTVPQDV